MIRRGGTVALANLDGYGVQLEYLAITTAAMRRTAELWAQARSSGLPTAPDPALDGDVILAAQALNLNTPGKPRSQSVASRLLTCTRIGRTVVSGAGWMQMRS